MLAPWRDVFDDGLRDVADADQGAARRPRPVRRGHHHLPHGHRGRARDDRPALHPQVHGGPRDLPGLPQGLRRWWSSDEHRHIAFGVRFLLDAIERDPRYGEMVERTCSRSWRRARPHVFAPPYADDPRDFVSYGYDSAQIYGLRLPHAQAPDGGARHRDPAADELMPGPIAATGALPRRRSIGWREPLGTRDARAGGGLAQESRRGSGAHARRAVRVPASSSAMPSAASAASSRPVWGRKPSAGPPPLPLVLAPAAAPASSSGRWSLPVVAAFRRHPSDPRRRRSARRARGSCGPHPAGVVGRGLLAAPARGTAAELASCRRRRPGRGRSAAGPGASGRTAAPPALGGGAAGWCSCRGRARLAQRGGSTPPGGLEAQGRGQTSARARAQSREDRRVGSSWS